MFFWINLVIFLYIFLIITLRRLIANYENASHPAMLNIAELVPPPTFVTNNSINSRNQFQCRPIRSHSGNWMELTPECSTSWNRMTAPFFVFFFMRVSKSGYDEWQKCYCYSFFHLFFCQRLLCKEIRIFLSFFVLLIWLHGIKWNLIHDMKENFAIINSFD